MDQKENDDAFIGRDINIEDSKPEARSSKKQRKRTRPQLSPAAAKRPKRPPPTPAPPEALISLIQRDVSVLSYFKSLQANLDYDVEKWKCEAQKWKKIAETAGKETWKSNGQNGKKSGAKKKEQAVRKSLTPPVESGVLLDNLTPSNNKDSENKHQEYKDDGSEIPITDEALFGGGDSSDEDQSSCCNETLMNGTIPSQHGAFSDRQRIVLDKLKEAEKSLNLLGVSLVEVEVKSTSMPADEETKAASFELDEHDLGASHASKFNRPQHSLATTIERIFHRQSDEKIAGDLMASLKTLIRTSSCIAESTPKSSDAELEATENYSKVDKFTKDDDKVFWAGMICRYHPFCCGEKLHIPTVYPTSDSANVQNHTSDTLPQHPASKGLTHVISILAIMDVYCSDSLSDGEWDALFESSMPTDEELLALKVGMRNRCRVAKRVLSSLDVEITRCWALADRASFFAEPTLFFHASDVIESGIEPQTNKSYSAKIYNRLVSMEERIAHARIATLLHRQRDDWQKAAELVIGYVVSCTPSIGVEQYPMLPPILSFCVLEALLSSDDHCPANADGTAGKDARWFQRYIEFVFNEHNDNDESKSGRAFCLLKAIAYPIHVSALIWKERSFCTDPRIRDVALIELAALSRIQGFVPGSWLEFNVESFDTDLIMTVGNDTFDSVKVDEKSTDLDYAMLGTVRALSLLTMGDIDKVMTMCEESMLQTPSDAAIGGNETIQCVANMSMMPLHCSIYVRLMCKKWDAMKLSSGWGRQTASAFTIVDRFTPVLETSIKLVGPTEWKAIESLLRCCILMSDGRNLLRIASAVLPTLIEETYVRKYDKRAQSLRNRQLALNTMTVFIDAGELPTVRVINLKRRPDRLLDFMSFSTKEQLIVMKGPVAAMGVNAEADCPGDYAFDGKWSLNELKAAVSMRLGGDISDYMATKWRPSDLWAFDRDARKDHELVQTSQTERACALSHIASWISVERSLSQKVSNDVIEGK